MSSKDLNNMVFKIIQISSQENMLLKTFEKFYEDKKVINFLIPIINSESEISIRLIDHFVTKYSKKNKVSYKLIEDNKTEISFNVFSAYKQQLKAYQKKNFDPFSRGDRIPYFFDDICIITTIGQLNFFKWFISKKLLDYVTEHKDDIENDMNKKNKNEKKTNKGKENKVNKWKDKIIKPNYNVSITGTENMIQKVKTSPIIVTFC
jgi:hypothetical protein